VLPAISTEQRITLGGSADSIACIAGLGTCRTAGGRLAGSALGTGLGSGRSGEGGWLVAWRDERPDGTPGAHYRTCGPPNERLPVTCCALSAALQVRSWRMGACSAGRTRSATRRPPMMTVRSFATAGRRWPGPARPHLASHHATWHAPQPPSRPPARLCPPARNPPQSHSKWTRAATNRCQRPSAASSTSPLTSTGRAAPARLPAAVACRKAARPAEAARAAQPRAAAAARSCRRVA
jgi:hypothetical protein